MRVAIIGTNGMLSAAFTKFYYNKDNNCVDTIGLEEPNGYCCNNFYKVNLLTDKLDYEHLLTSDVIIYAAAGGSLDSNTPNLSLMYSLNVSVPIEISIQLKKKEYNGVFVTFGSYMEIGVNLEDGKSFSEDEIVCTTLPATNDYTLSKRLLSRYLREFKAGFANYHFILPNMFTENDMKPGKRIVPYTLGYLQDYVKGNNPIAPSFSSGVQTRQFITLEEMIKTVDLSISKLIPSGIYNVGGGEFLSIRSLIERLFAIYNVPCKESYFGQEVRRDGDIQSLSIDGSKLYRAVGYLPCSKIEDIFSFIKK